VSQPVRRAHLVYDRRVSDPVQPSRPVRSESPEVVALRNVRARHPELSDAVDLQIELLELYRRVQGRVALPLIELNLDALATQRPGAALLKFDDIHIEPTDLRLLVRQMGELLLRHGAIEAAGHQRVQAIGRDGNVLDVVRRWYDAPSGRHAAAGVASSAGSTAIGDAWAADEVLEQVFSLALRPWLSRCAEVLQQRSELATWTHPDCPLCGAEPDLAVITPAAERHLVCSRCALRWNFETLTCPYCRNSDRARITSFATPDGEYRVYACDVCHRYLKALDGRRARRPLMPLVDAIATLPLDAAAMQRGYR